MAAAAGAPGYSSERRSECTERTSRLVWTNDSASHAPFKYPDNYVSTAKYTILTFLPKNLFEQFSRIANLYFLLISILQVSTNLSPTGKFGTIVPLAIVITVTAIKDAYEDYKRHQADKEVNNRNATVYRDGRQMTVKWSDIRVGDVVFLERDEPIPADLVFLSSSESHGTCYVETSSLDGETNLKIRSSVMDTRQFGSPDLISGLKCSIECEQPNKELYRYDGNMEINGRTISLTNDNILLRGMTMKNTKWVYGLVVYSGIHTKLMQNSTNPPHKRSKMERLTNKNILFIFLWLFLLSFVCAVLLGVWTDKNGNLWYVPSNQSAAAAGALGFITFLILFNNLIPISLYVSLEMVKVVQAYYISNDIHMYFAETNTPAQARTSSLNEELGQIQYVFSDKTGTLTQNRLEFMKCSIAGYRYGHGVTEIARAAAKRQGKTLEDTRPEEYRKKGASGFYDPKLLDGSWKREPCSVQVAEFFTLLSLCHSVVPEPSKENESIITYQASSPDDLALVGGARSLGFFFHKRTPTSLGVEVDGTSKNYELIATLEFNSTRKRMSVVIRTPEGKHLLLCKGADSVVFPRLVHAAKYSDVTVDHLQDFASEGLRTLCLAQREFSDAEFESFSQRYREATLALNDREGKINQVAEDFERELQLLGATGIEDKLQEGVPDTIEILAKAGIKTWVLTGDKQETAINIGFACALLDDTQEIAVVNATDEASFRVSLNESMKKISAARSGNRDAGLVIDGTSLSLALSEQFRSSFLLLGEQCRSVICCRVSPLQKAEVVELVRYSRNVVTLAIGDGANDVSMIQAAHVGVGISGLEGMQAARASDYSIGQFRFLQRLLLVHGRHSYRRNAKLVLYSFYKNSAMFLTQLWFIFYNGFSGTSLYERWTLVMFNVVFSAFPILAFGIFDRDVSERAALRFPRLYLQGRDNKLFTGRIFWCNILNAIFHSLVFFFVPVWTVENSTVYANGKTIGLYSMGLIMYACVVITITLKLALETSTWTRWNHISVWGSIASYFIFNLIYTNLYEFVDAAEISGSYGMFFEICTSASFWLLMPLIPVICLCRDFVYKFWKRHMRKGGERRLLYLVQMADKRDIFADDTADTIESIEREPEERTGLDHYGERRPVRDGLDKCTANYTGYAVDD
eukprot:ANDGO_07205.mRNA.1 Phospholipid-transporting ATPase 3